MDEELFSRRIAEAHAHVRLLQRQAEHQASGSDVLADAFQELETALEELRVADEQLRVQTQELVVTRDQVEAEHRRYKLLFEAAPDAYFVTDLHGSIREANRAARRLLGIPEAFLIGKPFGTYVAADAREGFRQTLRRLRDERSVDGWEFTLTPREGEPVEIMVTAALVDDPADRTSRIYWLVRDVTRQRRSEEEVRRLNRELERRVAERTEELVARTERERAARMFAEEAEARLAFLSEASRIFSSSLDVDATLFTVPRIAVPRLADWCGVFLPAPELPAEPASPLDLVTTSGGEPATDPLAGEMARHLRPAVASVYASGQPMTSGPADGPAPLVRGSIPDEPVRDAEGPLAMVCPLIARGRTIGVIAYVASAERHFSRADLRLAEELTNRAALAIENARLYREAREAVQLRDHFLSIIAHDLKGPVATIKGYAQLARRLVTRAQVAEAERLQQAFGAIDATANRLATQIDELLDLSRLQLGRSLGLERRPVDLAELARAVIANYQETSPSHRFRVASDPTSVVGAWDARRLERVLGNLLSNAVKFSPSGGEIAVRIGTESGASGDWAILTVTDNGIGIPAQDLPRIFEPFERAANASDRTGSGIGLASAKQIVEEHGGTIAVESAEGKGTTFIVRLPLGSSERPIGGLGDGNVDDVGLAIPQVQIELRGELHRRQRVGRLHAQIGVHRPGDLPGDAGIMPAQLDPAPDPQAIGQARQVRRGHVQVALALKLGPPILPQGAPGHVSGADPRPRPGAGALWAVDVGNLPQGQPPEALDLARPGLADGLPAPGEPRVDGEDQAPAGRHLTR